MIARFLGYDLSSMKDGEEKPKRSLAEVGQDIGNSIMRALAGG